MKLKGMEFEKAYFKGTPMIVVWVVWHLIMAILGGICPLLKIVVGIFGWRFGTRFGAYQHLLNEIRHRIHKLTIVSQRFYLFSCSFHDLIFDFSSLLTLQTIYNSIRKLYETNRVQFFKKSYRVNMQIYCDHASFTTTQSSPCSMTSRTRIASSI